MPTLLKAVLAILGMSILLHLGSAAAQLLVEPKQLLGLGVMVAVVLVESWFLLGLSKGKDGIRGLVAALYAVGAVAQALMGYAAFDHSMTRYRQPADLPTAIGAWVGTVLSGFVTYALTRPHVKLWMAEKTMGISEPPGG